MQNYVNRVTEGLLKLRQDVIYWPETDERKEHIYEKTGLFNCIGYVDGTLFPLANKPILSGESYYSRKCSYAINSQVFWVFYPKKLDCL